MNQRLVHRGPDDDGFYVERNVGLAMRRLSIIDLHTGKQPISNEDGTIWIVYNGEIIITPRCAAELQSKGHRFQTKSDTETIVHLLRRIWRGLCPVPSRNFAFAIWDTKINDVCSWPEIAWELSLSTTCVRKRSSFSLLKSSLSWPILEYPQSSTRETLPEYLAFGYLSGTRTFFQGIQKLAPGHVGLLTDGGEFSIRKYWEAPSEINSNRQSMSSYVDGYRDLLNRSVQSHLMSDVPLGVFLSGGIDSSAIAALMAESRKDRIETFSVGYSEQAYSELPYAELMAKHIRSNHHEVRISRKEFFDELPKLIWHEDEPLVWPSSVSLYFVARLAREIVKVVLTGEGSDETLAGYTRYPFTLWNSKLDESYRRFTPAQLRGLLAKAASSEKLSPALKRKLHHTFLARNGSSWTTFYFDNFYAAFSEADQHHLLSDELQFNSGDAYRDTMAFWDESKGSLLSRMLFTDIKTYLVEL